MRRGGSRRSNSVPSTSLSTEDRNLLIRTYKETKRRRYLRKNSSLVSKLDTDDEVLYDGVLIVQVICGTELGEIGSKPDVYCTIEADCNGVMCKKTKTKVVKGTTTPIWDETLCIPAEACQFLRIHVYSKKQFQRPVEIGTHLITLSNLDDNKKLDDNKPHALIVDLQPKGQVKLTLELLSHEKARQRKQEQHQTFGISLDKLALIEGRKIPSIIDICFREVESRGLTEVGIYRVPGVVGEIRRLKSAFDENTASGEVLASEADVNVVAGVIKQFFRDLPQPLFPEEMYHDFISLIESEGAKSNGGVISNDKLLSLFSDIPEPNISVIVRLVQHLQKIAEHHNKHRMDISNLALVFGPNVVRPPPDDSDGTEKSCQSLQFASMQQIGILKYFCGIPLHRLTEIAGDEDSLRPGSAPAIFSPTSDRNVTEIVRRVSVSASNEIISEEGFSFGDYSPLTEGSTTNSPRDPLHATSASPSRDPLHVLSADQSCDDPREAPQSPDPMGLSSKGPASQPSGVPQPSSSGVAGSDTSIAMTKSDSKHITLSNKLERLTISQSEIDFRKTL